MSRNQFTWNKLRRQCQSTQAAPWLSSVHFSPITTRTEASAQMNTECTGSEQDQDNPTPRLFTLTETTVKNKRDGVVSTVCPKLFRTPLMLGCTTVQWSHVERSCLAKELKWRQVCGHRFSFFFFTTKQVKQKIKFELCSNNYFMLFIMNYLMSL